LGSGVFGLFRGLGEGIERFIYILCYNIIEVVFLLGKKHYFYGSYYSDADIEKALVLKARKEQKTKSQIIKQAIKDYLEEKK